MSKNSVFRIVVGIMILASVLLGMFVNEGWFYFTLFIGANLLQSGLTKWCLMEKILDKFGLKDSSGTSCSI